MAKIALSTEAPKDVNCVSLANATVDEFPFETDDPAVIGNAVSHPWLEVEVTTEDAEATYRATAVDPKTDPLSAENPDSQLPFDHDAVAAAEAAKAEQEAPVAIEAGLDQDEVIESGGIAETIAADDSTPEQQEDEVPPPPPADDTGDAS